METTYVTTGIWHSHCSQQLVTAGRYGVACSCKSLIVLVERLCPVLGYTTLHDIDKADWALGRDEQLAELQVSPHSTCPMLQVYGPRQYPEKLVPKFLLLAMQDR